MKYVSKRFSSGKNPRSSTCSRSGLPRPSMNNTFIVGRGGGDMLSITASTRQRIPTAGRERERWEGGNASPRQGEREARWLVD